MEFARLRHESFAQSLLTASGTEIFADTGLSADSGMATAKGNDMLSAVTDSSAATFAVLPAGQRLNIRFAEKQMVNCVRLEEPVAMGQRVSGFSIHFYKDGKETGQVDGTTIGHQRILSFPARETDAMSVEIKGSKAVALISYAAAYHIDEALVEQ